MDFEAFFQRTATDNEGQYAPHPWQLGLANEPACADRLIRIPTGLGKTLGALTAWLWHRVERADDTWPRRLVWCLPMRVLVEQTEAEVRNVLARLNRVWNEGDDHDGKVGVHLLMGGADAGTWHRYPEHCAVLIGTQDMLLSRAMNRGYGAPRARWPMDFGLLNQDCLWVMDEVQLMDVGLATSGQLQTYRNDDHVSGMSVRPCRTWWMSATLQRAWLEVSPDARPMATALPATAVPSEGRRGPLWDDVQKPVRVEPLTDAKALAAFAAQAHLDAGRGRDGPTLIVVNTVDVAVTAYALMARDPRLTGTDLRLVHSRFRPYERAVWREAFLNRKACAPDVDRIVVATQVIEAGVDISAAVLVTQLAPWPSLVQRFGRAARWGGVAQVVVADFQPDDDKAAAPYTKDALDAARDALSHLTDVAPLHLEIFEETHPELLPALYPYSPKHLLLRHELEDLFDTTPDLSGADIDIARFIRSGDERDVQVFWQDIAKAPDPKLKPSRDALCAVPFLKARDWLCGTETAASKSPRLKPGMRAWVWSYLDGEWRTVERRDLFPGQTILVAAECGGYDPATGWSPAARGKFFLVGPADATPEEQADAVEDNESGSAYRWQTIAVHGLEVGREASSIAGVLVSGRRRLFELAGRWHDAGKAHEAFQNSIVGDERPPYRDFAKAPRSAWLPPRRLYVDNEHRRRRGFRHELASVAALFAILVRHQPAHPALLGPWADLLSAAGLHPRLDLRTEESPNTLESEIVALSPEDFDLLAYLICTHHGKVRVSWHAAPADQEAADSALRIRGIREGDTLPSVVLATVDGGFVELPSCSLRLDASAAGLNPVTGRGWTERVLSLLESHGPFALAYLEALFRAADQRASDKRIEDRLLTARSAKEPAA